MATETDNSFNVSINDENSRKNYINVKLKLGRWPGRKLIMEGELVSESKSVPRYDEQPPEEEVKLIDNPSRKAININKPGIHMFISRASSEDVDKSDIHKGKDVGELGINNGKILHYETLAAEGGLTPQEEVLPQNIAKIIRKQADKFKSTHKGHSPEEDESIDAPAPKTTKLDKVKAVARKIASGITAPVRGVISGTKWVAKEIHKKVRGKDDGRTR